MKFIKNFLTQHLQERSTNYWKHFLFAFGAGVVLILAGLASIVHAIVPSILPNYSEQRCRDLINKNELQNKK